MTFDDLLARHGAALWRAVASYSPPGAERDDLAQEVLVTVWQALARFRGAGSPRAFALRIAHNRGLSLAWSRKRRPAADPAAVEVADLRPGADDQLAAGPEVHPVGWVILAFCGAMGLGYGLLQRGLRPEEAGSPRAAVAFLERRLRVERRSAQLVRWGYAGLCAAFVLVFPRMVASHSRPELEMGISFGFMLVTLAATFSAPWWVARRNRRYEEELEGWRRWMDEQGL